MIITGGGDAYIGPVGTAQAEPLTVSSVMAQMAQIRQFLDEITVIIVCHPDDRARIDAALDRARAGAGMVRPVEVVTSEFVGPGTLFTMPKSAVSRWTRDRP